MTPDGSVGSNTSDSGLRYRVPSTCLSNDLLLLRSPSCYSVPITGRFNVESIVKLDS